MDILDQYSFEVYQILAFTALLPVLHGLFHAMRNISDPVIRIKWLAYFLMFNIVAVVLYWIKKPFLVRKKKVSN